MVPLLRPCRRSPRPGLLRDSGPKAGAVAVEVWSLPKAAFGSFIEQVPAPLSIGSVELSDGTRVKGFLCEADGIAGATEITHLGDWRAYLDQPLETA